MPYQSMFAEIVTLPGYQYDVIDAYLARPMGPGPLSGRCRDSPYAGLG